MTDKEIIIDGVNVLNCGHYSQFEGETENACYIQQIRVIGSDVKIGFGSCNSSPNCYYKQLKRKEQECEKFKQALREIKEIAKGYKPYKVCGDYNDNCEPINEILQKCEVIDETN